MSIHKHFFTPALPLFILLLLLLYPACHYRQTQIPEQNNRQLLSYWNCQQADGESQPILLPHTFHGLAPRTPLTLTTTVQVPSDTCLYIKSIYSPFRLYADDQLLYESGQPGSYPSFFQDPPTLLQCIPLPAAAAPVTLRLEYLSPSQRNELFIPNIEMGSKTSLLLPNFQQNGFSFLFSLLLLFLSLLLFAAAALLRRKRNDHICQAFLQLGLFAFSVGIWSFGECNLTGLFFPYPSLLYLFAFSGLFTCTIPLLKFGLFTLGLQHPHWLHIQIHLMQLAVITALFLQYTGILGLARSMYFFHIFLPLSLLLFAVQIFWAAWKHNNTMARRFAFPMGILAVSAILELINYQLRFTNVLSLFFQLGVLLFILSLVILSIHFIQKSLKTQEEKKQLEFDLLMAERQTEVQRTQYAILTEHEQLLRQQRHDLRHQLIVLKSYNEQGDKESMQHYLDELTAKIPVEKDLFLCHNFVVNSVALYYQSLARKQQIDLSLQLISIDEQNGPIQDSDLCVILGNLLENAIEACSYLAPEKRRIKLNSRIHGQKLFLLMENSYDGFCAQKSGIFFSRKRSGKGTGLSSIESVAHKYHGMVDFQPGPDTFFSSIFLELTCIPE